eukprot:CAMPEP_0117002552 /NCGR_PEP_ID=MMETSP0472-20121206/4182_1 /TAXON_ID=693140 ORGANISM="Tiarina fusus, Strain LIS" /NCGR_SAMPLE_ID=MMETSP0472 /ASSEMBLY_ACC=CAM_ASM_000603 /LENGTH=1199 /DNA_ID=CAMNT_0004702935 /DNA_START=255 /DNA_END=3854 /DNA_ORIENTATION=-
MLVSFRVTEDTDAYESLVLGSIQSGSIVQIQDDYAEVQLDCGVRGRLRRFHSSDIPSFYDDWMAYYKDNKKFSNLLVLSKPSHRPVELTRKFSLIESNKRGELPSESSDIHVGQIIHGFVKRISSIGIHIGFMGDFLGFVPKSQIADVFVENPSDFFELGQSVRAYVAEKDQKKLIMSLKQSLCYTDGVQWAEQVFLEEKILFRTFKRKNKKNKLAPIEIGDTITGKISQKTELGLLVSVDKCTSGLLLSEHAGEASNSAVDSSVCARVLDITQSTPNQRIIDLSALPASKEKKQALETGKEYSVRIELVKTKYLVVSCNGQIGFIPAADYNTILYADPFSSYKIGGVVPAVLFKTSLDALYSRSLLFSAPKKTASIDDAENQEVVSLSDIQPGMLVSGTVMKIVSHTMKLRIGYHVIGRISATEVFDDVSVKTPFSSFSEGDVVTAKVLNLREVASNRHLPISHQNPVTHRRLEMTIRPSKLKLPAPELGEPVITWKNAEEYVGKTIIVIVYEIQTKARGLGVYVSPEINGIISTNLLPENTEEYTTSLKEHFHLGQSLRARVCRDSLGDLDKDPYKELLVPGTRIMGRVVKNVTSHGMIVEIAPDLVGFVNLTEINDEYKRKIYKSIYPTHFRRMIVLPRVEGDNHQPLSIRKSRVEGGDIEAVDPIIDSLDDIKEGQIVRGYTTESIEGCGGAYVALSRTVKAYVPHTELAERVHDKIEIKFCTGRLVRGKILAINPKGEHPVLMTLRKSKIQGDFEEAAININNIKEGQKLKGYVKHIKDFGILIEIKHSYKLMGLCHKTQISDKKNLKWQEIFEVDDYVKVIVLRVDAKKNRLELGMKPSYFTDDDIEFDSDDEETDETNAQEVSTDKLLVDASDDSDSEEVTVKKEMEIDQDSSDDNTDDEVMDENDDDDSEDDTMPTKKKLGGAAFQWNDFAVTGSTKRDTNEESEEESEEDDDDNQEDPANSKRAKKLAKQREEENVAHVEEELISGDKAPETIGDYERLLLSSPNDSFLWIKYMAFLLSMTEIEKARAVVERGLKRINLREEEEKLNLWVAFMNLELMYGTSDSLAKVIERAIAYNDPKLVYQRLVDIYINAEKFDEAEKIFQRLIKKYKRSKGIWIKYCTFKMTNGESDAAHKLFQRAIELLPQRKHIALINKFAQIEYKIGDAERGRTMYEGIVSNYPKKDRYLVSLY